MQFGSCSNGRNPSPGGSCCASCAGRQVYESGHINSEIGRLAVSGSLIWGCQLFTGTVWSRHIALDWGLWVAGDVQHLRYICITPEVNHRHLHVTQC